MTGDDAATKATLHEFKQKFAAVAQEAKAAGVGTVFLIHYDDVLADIAGWEYGMYGMPQVLGVGLLESLKAWLLRGHEPEPPG